VFKRLATDYLVVVSDLHCGSTLGLYPPEMMLDDEHSYSTGTPQKALYAHWRGFWEHFVPSVTRGKPFSVVVNGDAVEGDHHNTAQIVSKNLLDHAKIAAELLRPVAAVAESIEIIRGTESHVGASGQYEEALAIMLGVPMRGGTHSRWELWAEMGKWLIHIAHHIGTTSSSAYEHSALSRELVANLVESAQWGERPADMIIRSHRHRCAFAGIPTGRGVCEIHVTPAWQMKTAFAQKTSCMRQPQVGGLVIGLDDYGQWVRRYVWVPPRNGVVGLTPDAVMRLACRGRRSRSKSPHSRNRRSERTD